MKKQDRTKLQGMANDIRAGNLLARSCKTNGAGGGRCTPPEALKKVAHEMRRDASIHDAEEGWRRKLKDGAQLLERLADEASNLAGSTNGKGQTA